MPLGTDEGLRAGDIVLDGDRTSPPPQKRGPSPHFRPMSIVAMQSAGWVKMPLGIEVDRGPGHIMLDGYPALPRKRNSSQQPSPLFDPSSRISRADTHFPQKLPFDLYLTFILIHFNVYRRSQ